MNRDFDSTYLHTDQERFCLFFKENYHTACLIANRYVKNVQQSEDLVQDVFAVLWEKRETLLKFKNPRNYLYTVVRNRALNFIQREKRGNVPFSAISGEIAAEDAPDSYQKEVMAVRIFRAIDELPPQCKKIFNLAYQHNLSYQEIAEELNLSKNTVKTQMGIAYKSLRIQLKTLITIGFSLFLKKDK